MTEPLIQQWHLVAFMLATLGCLIGFAAWQWWLTFRADRELRTERELRRGFKAAKRWGVLPEDLQ